MECSGCSVAVPKSGLWSWKSEGALAPVPALARSLVPVSRIVVGRGRAPGLELRHVEHIVDAPAEGEVQAVEQRDLVLGEGRAGRLLGRDVAQARGGRRQHDLREAVGLLLLGLGAEGEEAEGPELEVALVLDALAVADEEGVLPAGRDRRAGEEGRCRRTRRTRP